MDFVLIETQAALQRMAVKLAAERVVAFDIECASGSHHYINRVCLMQLSAGGESFVVDALAGLNLSPVGRILEDPAVEIVMHDTDFDLRCLDRDYGWHPRNLFDTLIAARLSGHREFGLAALCERHFGIRRSKKFQRADWTIRPVPRNMLEYAATDVMELVRLKDLLAHEIEKLGRMAWAREEFAQCEGKRFEPDERPFFSRIKKAREFCDGRDLAVLKELAEAREKIARAQDLAPFMVIRDESLIALAKHPPRTTDELAARRGLNPVCKGKYARLIVDAVHKGQKTPHLSWPRRGGHRDRYSPAVFDALKSWRTTYSEAIGVDPDLVLSMDSLRRLAGGEPIDDVLADEPVRKWRGEEIRQALDEMISGFRKKR